MNKPGFKYYFAAPPKPDISAVGRDDLIKTIRKCHQTLWGGGRLSPPTAFGELCKLIFVKTRDEKKPRRKGEPYEFQIKTNEKPERLAGRIRALYEAEQKKDPEVFNEGIKIDDVTLKNVVLHLEGVNLTATDLDTKGVAFEQFMDGFFKGDFGQYFTPRNIIAFSIQILNIESDDTVMDPACGSGGFLLHALDHIRKQASDFYPEDSSQHFNYWHDFAEKRLFGIEINEEIARVANPGTPMPSGGGHIIRAHVIDTFREQLQSEARLHQWESEKQALEPRQREFLSAFDQQSDPDIEPPLTAEQVEALRTRLNSAWAALFELLPENRTVTEATI